MAGPAAAIEISDDGESDLENGFDGLKEDLLECLDEIRTTDDIGVTKEYCSFVNPGLTVADNLIPLPLVPRDAETIKGACREPPFGRGDETVVDTSVRKTWELDATQFKCSNPEWVAYLTKLSKDAAESLALSNVRAEPYKLLLYEEGSFFKPHKDPEKVPGMAGTLVVCLPSKHQGGSFHLSYAGEKYVIDTDKTSEFGLTSLCWFSDVTHEIKTLTSGYRLVLTYNIIYESGICMSAGLLRKQSAHLRSLLKRWRTGAPSMEKLVYVLEHKYTDSSLSLTDLKGRDRAVCQSLYEASLECEFTIFLADMNRTIEDPDNYYDQNSDETVLENIKTCDGLLVYKSTDVNNEDILDADLWDRAPDSEDGIDLNGYGRAMPELHRYHDTVVIIIPIRHLSSLFNRPDPTAMVSIVNRSLRERPDDHSTHKILLHILEGAIEKVHTRDDGVLLSKVVTMAVKLKNWALYRTAVRASLKDETSSFLVFPTIARCINRAFRKDPSTPPDWDFWLGVLATELPKYPLKRLADVLPQLDSLVQNEDLKASFQDWKKPIPEKAVESKPYLDIDDYYLLLGLLISQFSDSSWLATWFTPTLAKRASKCLLCEILRLVHEEHKRNTSGAKDVFQCILEGCAEILPLKIEDLLKSEHKFPGAELGTLMTFFNIVHLSCDIGLSQQVTELIEKSCANICRSDAKAKYISPIIANRFLQDLTFLLTTYNIPHLESVKHLYIILLRNVLLANPPKRPREPWGWAYKPRACGPYCGGCQELDAFLLNSEVQTYGFRVTQDKRVHLESRLQPGPFMWHTIKGSSPHTLVITKTGTEYGEDLRKYNDSVANLVNQVSRFQCEYVRSLLGNDLYQKLVLLRDILGSEGVQQTEKREADGELDGWIASRPRLM
ncbi:hypothetical protein Hte_006840 [Hypoxylon texense]